MPGFRAHKNPKWKESLNFAKSIMWRKNQKSKWGAFESEWNPSSALAEGWNEYNPHLAFGLRIMAWTTPPKPSEFYQTRNTFCQMLPPLISNVYACVEWNPYVSYPFTLKSSRCYSMMPLWFKDLFSLLLYFNLKKENHILRSVDLKPQICTMKKNVRLLFSFFSKLQRGYCQLANTWLPEASMPTAWACVSISLSLVFCCSLSSWEKCVCVWRGEGKWRENDLERNW